MSVLIENGRAYIDGKLLNKNILIENGKISKITSGKPESDERINASGSIIFPGFIDPHVHFREPGLTHKEDFLTGSRAAAAGGVTCILDMPNTKPPTLTLRNLETKRELAKKSVVNFGFHFGSSAENLEEVKKVNGAAAIKIFMDASTGNMLIRDDDIIREIMSSARLCSMHAEGGNARIAIGLGKSIGRKIYLCHVSTEAELETIRKNKKNNVFVETTPHHLFLTKKDTNNFIRMKPSLGSETDRKALWESLKNGTVDTIGTDHAPHTVEEKESDDPPYGVPGVETRIPLMMDAVNKGRITLKRAVEMMCENPAKIFKIRNKGFIKEDFDGDLTIVDMKLRKKIRNDKLFTKCGWSPFDGRELSGFPTHTIVNGNVVFQNGEVESKMKGKEVEYG